MTTPSPLTFLTVLFVAVLAPSMAQAQAAADTETPPGMAPTLQLTLRLPRTTDASRYATRAQNETSLSLESVEEEVTAPLRAPGVTLHRVGTGLMALGTTTLVAGALGGFVGLIIPFGCNGDFCGLSSTSMALFTTGMVTGSLGLVSFFIGLALDIRGRIERGRPRPIAFTPDGFAIRF